MMIFIVAPIVLGVAYVVLSSAKPDLLADLENQIYSLTGLGSNTEAKELASEFDTAFAEAFDYTSYEEGLGKWDAWNPSDSGAGVSVGIIQFNQRVGSLPRLLQTMNRYDTGKFNEIFGLYARNALNPSWVKSADFNQDELKRRTILALNYFKKAQIEVAYQEYFVEIAMKSKGYARSDQQLAYVIYFYNLAVLWGSKSLSLFNGVDTVEGLKNKAIELRSQYTKRFSRIYQRMENDGYFSEKYGEFKDEE